MLTDLLPNFLNLIELEKEPKVISEFPLQNKVENCGQKENNKIVGFIKV